MMWRNSLHDFPPHQRLLKFTIIKQACQAACFLICPVLLDIINAMRNYRNLTTLVLILFPFLLTGLVRLAPRAVAVSQADEKSAQFLSEGVWTLATEKLNLILTMENWRSDAWEHLGQAEFEQNHYDQAVKAFEKARMKAELTSANLQRLSEAYMQTHHQAQAQSLWREISTGAPLEFDPLLTIASTQRDIGDLEGSIATLLKAHALRPNDLQVNYLLGIQLALLQPQDALQYLSVAESFSGAKGALSKDLRDVITEPDQNPIYRTLRIGQLFSSAGEWSLATAAFERVTRADDSIAFAWALLGEAQQHVNQSGLNALQKSLQLDPQSDVANALMALYYRRQNKPELALPYLQKAVQLNANEPSWLIELGKTLAESGDMGSALQTLKKATQVAPEVPLTWQSLAEFCFSRNVEITPTGLNAARKALSLNPGDPALQDLMGMGLMINGDLDSADRFLLKALEIDPENAVYHLHHGQYYIQKKDCSQAAIELRRAIDLSQEERVRSNASRLLTDFCPGF